MPGDPVTAYLGVGSNVKPEQRIEIKQKLGLDKPVHIQYLKWLKRYSTGDFGDSVEHKKPVKKVISLYIWNTFLLNTVVFFLAFLIAIPVGIISAVKKYSKFDNFWTVFSLVGVSMLVFFFGLIMILLFSIKLKFLPMNGMFTPGSRAEGLTHAIDIAKHMVLPVTVLTISSLASLVRYVRNSMLEVIKQDYIRTAKSKGLNEKVVIYKHAFRNALIPIITLIGVYIPLLFTGGVITETIFNWPGIGRILYNAVMARDYSVVMALNMLFAILLLLGNLL